MQDTPAYRPRPVRCIELGELDEWRIKVCGIARRAQAPARALGEAATRMAGDRLRAGPTRA